jgi:peptidoglycan/LPS O-acetylase OafA/YrhL
MVLVETNRVVLPAWWRKVAAAAIVLLVFATIVLTDQGTIPMYQGAVRYETLTALACALLLALVVLPAPAVGTPLLVRALETRALAWIGLASYSLFLWHEPIIRWAQGSGLTFGGRLGFVVDLLVLGSLCLGLAALTYLFVERPALARKRR